MKGCGVIVLVCVLLVQQAAKAGGITAHLQELIHAKEDTLKVKLLSDLCWEYRFVSTDSALIFGSMALRLADKLNFSKGVAQALNDIGIIYIDKADYKKATENLHKSMKIREQLNDRLGMASLYNKLGIIDQKQGRLKEALENQIAALKIFRELGQDKWIGYTLNNIAIIHQNLGNLEKSLGYHKSGLEYRLKMKDITGEANSYSNMANVYAKMRDTTLSLFYYEKALSLSRNLKNGEYISANLSNMGNIYMAKGDFQRAIHLFSESLEIRERLGDSKGISSTLSRLGSVLTETGRYHEASAALIRSLTIARKISVVEEEMSAMLGLARLKALTHQPDSAIVLMKQYITTRDSVYNEQIRQQILDVQNKYENEKLEQDLQLIKKENEFAEIRLSQRKTQIWLLVFIMISMTGAGIFLFYRNRQHQKSMAATEKLVQQEARMKAVFSGQEEERRRIARELHDGIGQTLSAIKLNYNILTVKSANSIHSSDFNQIEKMLDIAYGEVRTISHQMMPKELEQFGLIAAVEGMLMVNLQKTPLKYQFEHNGFEERVGDQIELVLFRVLQELLSNVIKHSQANLVNVQLLKLTSHVVLNVSDNGVGFDVETHEKKGIGLLNIAGRIDGIKGHLRYESFPGTGTSVTVRTPIQ